MFRFRLNASTICSREYAKEGGKYSFISCDNNNLYSYNNIHPGIWAFNVSKRLWYEVISLRNHLESFPGDKIIGIVKEYELIKIFSINRKNIELKTRLHICNLETKTVTEVKLKGFLPDTACSCQMNIFLYGDYYYTCVFVKSATSRYHFKIYVFRLCLADFTWECFYRPSRLSSLDTFVKSTFGIINCNNFMYVLSCQNIRTSVRFDLENRDWHPLDLGLDVIFGHNSDEDDDDDDDKKKDNRASTSAVDFEDQRDQDTETPEQSERQLKKRARIDPTDDFDQSWNSNHPPIGQYLAYEMSKYIDPDSNDTCLILSGRHYDGDLTRSPLKIWKLNLITLNHVLLDRFGSMDGLSHFRRWPGVTPNGKLITYEETRRRQSTNNDDQPNLFCETVYTTWIRIPNLDDICWDAVIYYFPEVPLSEDERAFVARYKISWSLLKDRTK